MTFRVAMDLSEAELSLLNYMASTLPDTESQNLQNKVQTAVKKAMKPEDGQFDLTFDQPFAD
jgi:hypothetical protein